MRKEILPAADIRGAPSGTTLSSCVIIICLLSDAPIGIWAEGRVCVFLTHNQSKNKWLINYQCICSTHTHTHTLRVKSPYLPNAFLEINK